MEKFLKSLVLMVLLFLCSSCRSLYKRTYQQISPVSFEPTKNVYVFPYYRANIQDVYELFFSDLAIIGKSDFTDNEYNMPTDLDAVAFAKSIGADVFIATYSYGGTYTYTVSTPNTSRVTDSKGRTIANVTTYSDSQRTGNLYYNYGYFLKNVNNVKLLMEQTRDDYACTTNAGVYSGVWKNDTDRIKILRSDDKIVGFVMTPHGNWNKNDLKFIFSEDTGKGVFLLNSKMPNLAIFELNKFGYLEIKLSMEGDNEIISFMHE